MKTNETLAVRVPDGHRSLSLLASPFLVRAGKEREQEYKTILAHEKICNPNPYSSNAIRAFNSKRSRRPRNRRSSVHQWFERNIERELSRWEHRSTEHISSFLTQWSKLNRFVSFFNDGSCHRGRNEQRVYADQWSSGSFNLERSRDSGHRLFDCNSSRTPSPLVRFDLSFTEQQLHHLDDSCDGCCVQHQCNMESQRASLGFGSSVSGVLRERGFQLEHCQPGIKVSCAPHVRWSRRNEPVGQGSGQCPSPYQNDFVEYDDSVRAFTGSLACI